MYITSERDVDMFSDVFIAMNELFSDKSDDSVKVELFNLFKTLLDDCSKLTVIIIMYYKKIKS